MTMKKAIGVDVRGIHDGFKGGVGEYTHEVLTRMSTGGEYELRPLISGQRAKRQSLYPIAGLEPYPLIQPNKILNASLILRKRPFLDQVIAPAVQGMYMPNLNITSLSPSVPLVVTVHDLSFDIFPEVFSTKMRIWHRMIQPHRLLHRAQGIIAVSHSTARDIHDMYQIPKERIHVIHPGVSEVYFPLGVSVERREQLRAKYQLPEKFLLYLGVIEPRKNIQSVVKAFEEIAGEVSDTDLVIAGKTGWLAEQSTRAIRDSPVRARIHPVGFIDPEDKPDLYRLAQVFVYPSYYEGFGFPPIEAMACGTPTITSHTSSLPEVVEEAAWKVSPYDSGELAWAMKEILQNSDLASEYRQKGPVQARKFQWEANIQRMHRVFRQCFS